jgi:MATE family multidrug resistance protein
MLTNLIGHWGIGLPAGWLLCYRAGLGVYGIWAGLSIGLIVVAAVLVLIWRRRSRYADAAAASFVRECV